MKRLKLWFREWLGMNIPAEIHHIHHRPEPRVNPLHWTQPYITASKLIPLAIDGVDGPVIDGPPRAPRIQVQRDHSKDHDDRERETNEFRALIDQYMEAQSTPKSNRRSRKK